MKTRRPGAIFSSIAFTGLLGLTLVLTSLPASAVEYDDACYPPKSPACEVKRERTTDAKPIVKPAIPLGPVQALNDKTKENLIRNLQSNDTTKPFKLSDSAVVGGKSEALAISAIIDTRFSQPKVTATPNKPLGITAFVFTKGNLGGYVQVYLSVSGRAGNINLGRFTPSDGGLLKLPALTLESGARATFILRDMLPFSQYKKSLRGNPPTTFKYGDKTYRLADYGSDGTDEILMSRSVVVVTAD